MRVSWDELLRDIAHCEKCELSRTRTNVVPGEGNPHADLMFIGEGPGRDEDEQGRPFVGAAGQLLDKMIAAIGYTRDEVYIANVVKCRPPQNREPEACEALACLPHLRAQFVLIRPKVIVALGKTAAKYVYDSEVRITRDRGKWKQAGDVWILPTFHPAALLRDPLKKFDAWADLQAVRDKLLVLGATPGVAPSAAPRGEKNGE